MSEEQRSAALQAAMAAMIAFRPTDELEGMIAAQAVALHSTAMECLRRAMLPNQPAQFQHALLRDGANLTRAFTDMLDALDRKRGKHRRQTVRVERVTVEAGGRAIVGNVSPATPHGGEVGFNAEGEPHAPRARLEGDPALGAEIAPLRRQDTARVALRGAGDARQAAVPHARRRQHRAEDSGRCGEDRGGADDAR